MIEGAAARSTNGRAAPVPNRFSFFIQLLSL